MFKTAEENGPAPESRRTIDTGPGEMAGTRAQGGELNGIARERPVKSPP